MTQVHPSAVVHKDARLADDVVVGPNCFIDSGVSIGAGTVLEANVVIQKNVTLGRNNLLFPSAVIGCRPQVLRLGSDSEIGQVIIGDGNVIREQVTIHPGMHPGSCTRVGNENLLMVGVHLGHDCTIEDKIVMSNYVQIGGHCRIEIGAWLSGLAASHQFVTIGKWCYVAGLAGLNRDIPPFLTVSGHYPPRIRAVNQRGMDRAGLNEQQQQNITEAFKKLYRQGGALLENTRALAAQEGIDENVQAIVDSILNSSKHQFGRYLETFRH